MAPKTKKEEFDGVDVEKTSSGRLLKTVAVLLALLVITGAGFALGVYLKLIDIPGMAAKWKLHDYPVIGRYFTKPQMNFEPVSPDEQQTAADAAAASTPKSAALPPEEAAQAVKPAAGPAAELNKIELDKLAKARQQEENKRISKLARLYGGMKAEEAVKVLNELEDADVLAILNKMEEDQAAKILALMDAVRSARLTEIMLRGQTGISSPRSTVTN